MDSRAYAAGGVLNRGDGRLRALQLWYGRVVVDLASVVRELEGELRERGGRTQAHPVGELLVAGKLPGAALATFVLESDRIARAVVSQLRVPPFMSGVAMVIHPVAEVEAPVLLADLIIAPTGRARALLDAAGPGILNPTFADDFGIPLAHVVDGCEGVRRSTVPAWLAPLSGGGGATLRSERGEAHRLADVLVRYVHTYLKGLEGAPRKDDKAAALGNAIAARTVRDLVRANGPARRWLARAFGEREAERYLRLFWREDVKV
ncbi:MAG: hypothetical protein ACLQVI_11705 [Polyangiaceae bacterium]